MVKATEPFAFNYVPPKEGRVPSAVRIQRRRRATFIFILVLIVLVCLVLKYVQTTSLSAARTKLEAGINQEWASTKDKLKNTNEKGQAVLNTLPAPNPVKENAAESKSLTPLPTPTPTPSPVPQTSLVQQSSKEKSHSFDDDEFDELFQAVLDKLPSEMHQSVLLTPITNSGTQRIHDLGLRTREFKKLFETWEALHLVFHEKSLYIQDDIIHYLRERSVKGKILPKGKSADEAWELGPTVRAYETYRWLLQSLGDVLFPWVRPFFGDHMQLHAQLYGGGKGIVFTAGTDQAPFVETSISVLRNLGCKLPVEVMYLGEGDLDEDARERLEELPGVITRDIRQMVKDEGWALAGWAGKPFAILLSSFREVIFIDADALFLQNPDILFEDKSYKQTGALFFHDRLMKGDGKRHWMESVLPRPVSKKARKSRMWGQSDHMQESGVIVVDTFKHFIPLLVVSRMNGPDRDGNSEKGIVGVYDMLFGKSYSFPTLHYLLPQLLNQQTSKLIKPSGDKETFWLSWELVGDTNYAFHSGPAGVIGNLPINQQNISHTSTPQNTPSGERFGQTYTENITMCAPQLLHIGRDGVPLWFNGWILANKFEKHKSPIAQLEMYMREPDHYMEPESWTIGESNSCCLRATETLQFTKKEKETIEMILRTAFEVGAVGKKGGAPTRGGASLYG